MLPAFGQNRALGFAARPTAAETRHAFSESEVFAMADESRAPQDQHERRHYLLVSQETWLVEWYQLSEHGVRGHPALADAADAVVVPKLNLAMTFDFRSYRYPAACNWNSSA